jgi:hypothetical protein
MATLDVLLDCCTRLQQSHLQPNILAMTTSKGKITIPFAVFMSFGGISDQSLLEMYMVYLRFNRETASFKLLLNMQWTKSSRGIRLHLTFDLLASEAVPLQKWWSFVSYCDIPDHGNSGSLNYRKIYTLNRSGARGFGPWYVWDSVYSKYSSSVTDTECSPRFEYHIEIMPLRSY